MALHLPLKMGRYLNWETMLPYPSSKRVSPVFTYMNEKWNLLFEAKAYEDYYVYCIVLIKCDAMQSVAPFTVSTYLQSTNSSEFKCSSVTINSGFEFLYFEKYESVNQKMGVPDPIGKINVTVKCVFPPSTDEFLNVKIDKEDKAIDNPEEDINSENDSKLSLARSNCLLSDQASAVNVAVSHFQSISEDLGSMFNNDLMSDVKIKCGDVIVSAHKDILAARSKYFANMFQNEKYKNIGILDNLTIKSSVLHTFIRYLYTGEIKDLSEDNALDLYSTSYEYEVHALRKECSNFLAKCLSPENFLNILTLADEHDDANVKEAIVAFVSTQSSLLATDKFIDFSRLYPIIAIEIYQKYIENTLSNNIRT